MDFLGQDLDNKHTGNVDITGDLDVGGDFDIDGDIDIKGEIKLNDINAERITAIDTDGVEIRQKDGIRGLIVQDNKAVALYYNGNPVFYTTTAGVVIQGGKLFLEGTTTGEIEMNGSTSNILKFATDGKIQRDGIDKLLITTTETKSEQKINMNNNDINNVGVLDIKAGGAVNGISNLELSVGGVERMTLTFTENISHQVLNMLANNITNVGVLTLNNAIDSGGDYYLRRLGVNKFFISDAVNVCIAPLMVEVKDSKTDVVHTLTLNPVCSATDYDLCLRGSGRNSLVRTIMSITGGNNGGGQYDMDHIKFWTPAAEGDPNIDEAFRIGATHRGGNVSYRDLSMNNNILILRNNTDFNNALRVASTGVGGEPIGFAGDNTINGPVLSGYNSGVLGTKDGASELISMKWNADGINMNNKNISNVNDIIYLQTGACFAAGFNASTPTTIDTKNVNVPVVLISAVAGYTRLFEINNTTAIGEIKYTGTRNRWFNVIINMNYQVSLDNTLLSAFIYANGADTGFTMRQDVITANKRNTISLNGIIELATNNTIRAYLYGSPLPVDIIVQNMTLTCIAIT